MYCIWYVQENGYVCIWNVKNLNLNKNINICLFLQGVT